MFLVKELSWAPYVCGLQVVMPDMSAKSLCIYPHVCVSTWSVIEPLTFSDIYKILNNVILYTLMSVLAS